MDIHIRIEAPRGAAATIAVFVGLPIAVVMASAAAARATLTPIPSDWAKPMASVSSSALAANLTQLDARIGRYVGSTNAQPGALSGPNGETGYAAAKALCAAARTSTSAHLCTAPEMALSAQEGLVEKKLLRYAAGVYAQADYTFDDCLAFTSSDSTHVNGWRADDTAKAPAASLRT